MSAVEQGVEDRRVLTELLALEERCHGVPYLTEVERLAFEGMAETLECGRYQTMTARQRRWVNEVAGRVDVEPSVGPEDDEPREGVRFTEGPPPRGREVELLVRDHPTRPPTKRKKEEPDE
jgi:hypothetical protein